jgi:HSP20 family protein
MTPQRKSSGAPSPYSLRDQFDELFDAMLRGWPSVFGSRGGGASPLSTMGHDFAPRVDTSETEKAYEVSVELPGVEEKDIKLSIDNDTLTISGEKKSSREDKQRNYHVSECSYGSFQRSFTLPDNVAQDKIAAAFDKGVLKVTLPKTAPTASKQRTIPIGKS